MPAHQPFKLEKDRSTRNSKDIYNADNNSFEKDNNEKLSKFEKVKSVFIQYASLWRKYPDLFIDMITPKDSNFKLFFYQRIFLRVCMRYRYMFATFTRAFSKSFLSIFSLYLKCIFYPGIKLFICSGGKQKCLAIF